MSRKYSTVVGLAAGAAAAAFIGMGTAHADVTVPLPDPYSSPDPYDVLFGGQGTQGADNATLDSNLDTSNPSGYEVFNTDVSSFEAGQDHALENLIFALDPSSFYEQTGGLVAGDVGTLAGGAYLVPDDALGYLATGLDYGLLTPTGLDYVLTPLIDLLLGSSI
jgi:hypothetical protein